MRSFSLLYFVMLAITIFVIGGCTGAHKPVPGEAFGDAAIGDVIFLRTTTWKGRAVRFLELGQSNFSHVAIVTQTSNQGLWVVHAAPEESGKLGHVREESWLDLLARGDIVSAAIFRPKASPYDRRRAVEIAVSYALRKTPFDKRFKLDDDGAVYCTELIWLAYRKFGLELSIGDKILFPSDLLELDFFENRVN